MEKDQISYKLTSLFICLMFPVVALFAQVPRIHQICSVSDTTPGVDGLDEAFSVVEAPDGRFVYVGAVADRSVTWFYRDSLTGTLSYAGRVTLSWPAWNCQSVSVAVSPDSKNLYASAVI